MASKQDIIQAIRQQAMLPLFYHADGSVCEKTVEALYLGGVRVIEFTNRGDKAPENFRSLVQQRNRQWPGLLLGIGTIKTVAEAEVFIQAGADFIICPGTVPEVGEAVHRAGLLWIPGCMTVTEILLARQTGAVMIKLFPGNLLGPSFMAGIRDIFPELYFMPTGGVELTEGNLSAWFSAGVSAVGLGSKFLSGELLESRDYAKMRSLAEDAIKLIATYKKLP